MLDADMQKFPTVNNAFYDELGERWYSDDTHAVALLRREAEVKLQYVLDLLERRGVRQGNVIDIGAGAGFIANPLGAHGFNMTVVDISASSLAEAERHAPAGASMRFLCADAYQLNEPDESQDVVLLLDFLEHVEDPARIIAMSSRLLKPGGILIFHTFNRTFPAWLLAVKAIALFTRDCPQHVHVHHLFIKPTELKAMAARAKLAVQDLRGIRPKFNLPLITSGLKKRLSPKVGFTLSRSLSVGYIGYAVKETNR